MRAATQNEIDWLCWLEQMPCIVCDIFHHVPDSPAEIHHLDGQTKKDAHLNTIALCDKHHRNKDNEKPPRWISRHGDGKKAFENFYIDEKKLLELQQYFVKKLQKECV